MLAYLKNLKRTQENERSNMTFPTHFIDEKNKVVVFHIKVVFSVMMPIAIWIKSFPDDFKGISCRCAETFYKLSAKVND